MIRWVVVGLCLALGPATAWCRTAPLSHAETLEAYKAEVARHIQRTSAKLTFEGAAPPLLKSVVVLSITIEPSGAAHAKVVRSNGIRSLEARAVHSVRHASPLPRWDGARGRSVHFYETWLFRRDGRFQIRSIAPPQASI